MDINLQKIGSILKEERERKGYSLQDISNALCVRKSLISALEAGESPELPHEFYIKSYVKNYANFLGEYEKISELLHPPALDLSAPEAIEGAESPQIAQEKSTRIKTRLQSKKRTAKRFSKTTAVYLAVLAVLATIFVYEAVDKNYDKAIEQTQVSRMKADARPIVTNNESGNARAIVESKKLVISCHERTWISVVIDGKEKKEFMLSPQEVIMLNAEEGFDLLIGNAGGVKLILNGKDTEFTGKSGEVKRVKLS